MASVMCEIISPELLELFETPPVDFIVLDEFYGHIQACPACADRFPELVIEAKNCPEGD